MKSLSRKLAKGNNALNREVSRLQNVVTEVNLAGYRRTKSKMVSRKKLSSFRPFISIDETNRILFERINGNNKCGRHQRLSDLEKEIEDAEKESSDFFKCIMAQNITLLLYFRHSTIPCIYSYD